MEKGLQLQANEEEQKLNRPYRELLGSLMYLMLCSRPDICYQVGYLRNSEALIGYTDADWASDTNDRKSISGYIFKMYVCSVSWCIKKPQTVASSSSEAEYVALSLATAEAIWIKGIMQDLHEINESYVIKISEDNGECIGKASNLESKRVKHIDIKTPLQTSTFRAK
ncbi:uncharacterized protein LOC142225084 [Haematobia irritans]|uniref:uncharacterized protein LOC142225084 n=1 Tax=Haematobia irritans TaxID=7368 RepID=UPI003F50641E